MKDMKELLHSAHLTKTQKIIAEYVLDNASEACFMTSTEIALKLGVSESSVIRFSRTIGFDGFMDFQKALRKDYQDKVLSISSSITVPSQRIAKQAKLDTSSDYINRSCGFLSPVSEADGSACDYDNHHFYESDRPYV